MSSWSQKWNKQNTVCRLQGLVRFVGQLDSCFIRRCLSNWPMCADSAFGYTKEEQILFLCNFSAALQHCWPLNPPHLLEKRLVLMAKHWTYWHHLPNWTHTLCISEWCTKWAEWEDMVRAYGVPQHSVKGPIEFCIYTIPLGAILNHYKINYQCICDDTQIYCSFPVSSLDEVLDSISDCILDILSWMKINTNRLEINYETEFLLITSPHETITRPMQIP